MTPHRSCSAFFLAATLLVSGSALAQAPHPLTAADTQRINELIGKMTLEQKLDYIGGTGFATRAVPSLGLPALEMSDGPFGTRSNAGFPSTTYAAGIGLAASWDRDLATRVGAGIGRDARARGVHFMLGPGVNIYRSPRNGRNFEYFGEDPFLASKIAVGYITGMQQQGVSATIKHFAANSSEYLRHDSDSIVDERTLREIYLPTFEAAVKQAHVGAIMDSYNLINGEHATQNTHLNIDIVRKEWGFTGTMMSDWDATYDAVRAANGGLDLEMPTGKFMNRANLLGAVKSGTVPQATIDEKLRHILTTASEFGWLDRAGSATEAVKDVLVTDPKLNSQTDLALSVVDTANAATALEAARESAVLLKNTGSLLPLNKSAIKTILVVGPDAYPGVPVGGGSAGVVPFHLVSALEGVTQYLAGSGATVLYDRGVPTISVLAEATDFTTAPTGGKAGLTRERFENKELTGTPVASAGAEHINDAGLGWDVISSDPEALAAVFKGGTKESSRRFAGYYNAAAAGPYLLALQADGEGAGNRVYVDDKLVIDNWKIVRAFEPHLALTLTAGPHKIVVEDWQSGPLSGRLRLAIVPENRIVSARAKALAARADVILVAAGFGQESESEGGDRTFALPFGQDQLIQTMAAANRKTIVTVTSGGNVDSQAWIDRVPALLETWYAGQAGGTALAEMLFGDVNPSGHLPVSFERRAEDNPAFANYYPEGDSKRVLYKEGLFVGYRGYERSGTKPLFPFGYGLSYTTFSFAHLTVTPPSSANRQATASFDVTNTGTRKGATVAQLYLSEDKPKVERPARELKGFERVELAGGETKHVTIPLDGRAFAYYDVGAKKWTANPGSFTVHVGDSVEFTPLETTIQMTRETVAAMDSK